MASNLTLWQARDLALQPGVHIRREAWLDRLIRHADGWWQIANFNNATRAQGPFRPIEATDYTPADLRATDWTDDPIPALSEDPTLGGIIAQQNETDERLSALTADGLILTDIGEGTQNNKPNGPPWKGTKWKLAAIDASLALVPLTDLPAR